MALVQLERKKAFHPKTAFHPRTVISLREKRWWKEAASDEVIIYRKIHDRSTQVPAQERGRVLLILNVGNMCLCFPCSKAHTTHCSGAGEESTSLGFMQMKPLCTGSWSTSLGTGWGCSKGKPGRWGPVRDEARLRCSCSITQART